MAVKKNVTEIIQFLAALIPAAVSLTAVLHGLPLTAVGAFCMVLLVVGILPLCRKRESLWVFFLMIWTGAPVNVWLIRQLFAWGILDYGILPARILRSVLVYIVLFSVQQAVMALAARLLWPQQLRPGKSRKR